MERFWLDGRADSGDSWTGKPRHIRSRVVCSFGRGACSAIAMAACGSEHRGAGLCMYMTEGRTCFRCPTAFLARRWTVSFKTAKELFGSRIAPCKGGRTGESLVTTRMNRSSEGITRIRCFEIIAGESGSARATESVTLRIDYLFRQLGFPVVWYMALPKMPREMFGSPTRMPASFEYPPEVKFKRFSWKAWDVRT